MILIEPPRTTAAARRDLLNQRELAHFTRHALEAAGARGTITVLLTSDERIRELNRQFRKKNSPTDVLSFPAILWDEEAARPRRTRSIGDLAISLETAACQAASHGHSLATEVRILILHGILHLAGYDHETDTGQMARLERKLRKQIGLPSGLIQRTIQPASLRPATKRVRA